ncbi:hypothetical protein [Caldicoprobacter faecalis]|uniref:Uncharacterized protein n=1 Tax=Caldicoprobacter faecalis TaxID=937334 RepID=A0A1I5WTT6_9FIRM|nr:hypothetical protein [Caldicoprobacter faecalis]SFQ23129.1 hypothetical protein SAMN05444406_11930 [Caldicoprobacter faecalis]
MLFGKNKKIIDLISLQIKNDFAGFFDYCEADFKEIEKALFVEIINKERYIIEHYSVFNKKLNEFIKKEINTIFDMQNELNIKFKQKIWQEAKAILKQYVNSTIEEYKEKVNEIIDALFRPYDSKEKELLKNRFKVDLYDIDALILVAEEKSMTRKDKPEVQYQRRSLYISVFSLIVSIVSIILSVVGISGKK